MNRLLVTGGMGFIGSHFIKLLRASKEQFDVVNLDAMSYGSNPHNVPKDNEWRTYRFVNGSTTDIRKVKSLLHDVDAVVNFAAETHVDRSIANPHVFFENNVMGTMILLENARHSDCRFVHISTDEVYGPATNADSFVEQDKLTPSSPYAASKAAADLAVQSFHNTYGLHTIILRSTNNFGPNQFPEKFIPKVIIRAITGRSIPIYGDGAQIRDWVYVEDFCRAALVALKGAPAGTIYNVSAGNEFQNLELAKRICAKLNKPQSMIEFVENRPGHDARYSLNAMKIRNELGWEPTRSFDEALNETVEWYINNPRWWRPLLTDAILSSAPWKQNWN